MYSSGKFSVCAVVVATGDGTIFIKKNIFMDRVLFMKQNPIHKDGFFITCEVDHVYHLSFQYVQ